MLTGEDFGYLKDEDQARLPFVAKRALVLAGILFSIFCFIYITVSAYYFVYNDKDGNVKVIKSPAEPIKVVEEGSDAAGIKDIDKTIYDNIVGNKSLSRENLDNVRVIEQAETPSNKGHKEIVVNNPISKSSITGHEQVQNKNSVPKKINSSEMLVYNANQQPSQQDSKVNDASLVSNKKEQQPPQEDKKLVIDKPARGVSRVQLAALTSRKSATEYWLRLNRSHPKLFSGLNYFVSEVKVGQKGIFYRLQIGNFRSQVEAEDFCRKFTAQSRRPKSDCMIVE
ncbi:MAG: hypothetical protein K0R25_62 [Rickettsiaceae bacterium]|jgi:hypothetical protein|nr:hypothetical protein [Rickettsiaceae bacterium]